VANTWRKHTVSQKKSCEKIGRAIIYLKSAKKSNRSRTSQADGQIARKT
jgi:hypothetical protein